MCHVQSWLSQDLLACQSQLKMRGQREVLDETPNETHLGVPTGPLSTAWPDSQTDARALLATDSKLTLGGLIQRRPLFAAGKEVIPVSICSQCGDDSMNIPFDSLLSLRHSTIKQCKAHLHIEHDA